MKMIGLDTHAQKPLHMLAHSPERLRFEQNPRKASNDVAGADCRPVCSGPRDSRTNYTNHISEHRKLYIQYPHQGSHRSEANFRCSLPEANARYPWAWTKNLACNSRSHGYCISNSSLAVLANYVSFSTSTSETANHV